MPEILLHFDTVPGFLGTVLLIMLFVFVALVTGALLIDKLESTYNHLKDYIPRCAMWSVISAILLFGISVVAPQNLPVILYKIGLVTIAAVMGYYIDRTLFPYARPHKYSHGQQVGSLAPHISTLFAASMLRRSVIVLACILGLTLGL